MSRLLRRLSTVCWLWFVFFAATAQPVRAVAFDDGWQVTNGDVLVGEAVSFSYTPGQVKRFVAASPGETVVFAVQVNNEATNSIGYQQIIADSWGITLSAGGVNASGRSDRWYFLCFSRTSSPGRRNGRHDFSRGSRPRVLGRVLWP